MFLRSFSFRASHCLVLIFLLALTAPAARAQIFEGIPAAPGYSQLSIRDVSTNGEVVFGTAWNYTIADGLVITSSRAFRWENGEMTLLSPLFGHGF